MTTFYVCNKIGCFFSFWKGNLSTSSVFSRLTDGTVKSERRFALAARGPRSGEGKVGRALARPFDRKGVAPGRASEGNRSVGARKKESRAFPSTEPVRAGRTR